MTVAVVSPPATKRITVVKVIRNTGEDLERAWNEFTLDGQASNVSVIGIHWESNDCDVKGPNPYAPEILILDVQHMSHKQQEHLKKNRITSNPKIFHARGFLEAQAIVRSFVEAAEFEQQTETEMPTTTTPVKDTTPKTTKKEKEGTIESVNKLVKDKKLRLFVSEAGQRFLLFSRDATGLFGNKEILELSEHVAAKAEDIKYLVQHFGHIPERWWGAIARYLDIDIASLFMSPSGFAFEMDKAKRAVEAAITERKLKPLKTRKYGFGPRGLKIHTDFSEVIHKEMGIKRFFETLSLHPDFRRYEPKDTYLYESQKINWPEQMWGIFQFHGNVDPEALWELTLDMRIPEDRDWKTRQETLDTKANQSASTEDPTRVVVAVESHTPAAPTKTATESMEEEASRILAETNDSLSMLDDVEKMLSKMGMPVPEEIVKKRNRIVDFTTLIGTLKKGNQLSVEQRHVLIRMVGTRLNLLITKKGAQ